MEKETECIGCYNIREKNYPTYGYSHAENAYIMHVAEGWKETNGKKRIKLVYIRFCPVCGKELENK